MSSTNQASARAGVSTIPKADWWKAIIETVTDPIKLLTVVALVILVIFVAGTAAQQQPFDSLTAKILAGVLGLIVVAAVVASVRRPSPKEVQSEAEKFKPSKGDPDRRVKWDAIWASNEPAPDLDTWYRRLRPTLHQASFYTVPTYYLDTDLNVLDYNIAFEIVFRDIAGRLRGKHVNWFIARLKNYEQVYEHGREFTDRVKKTGSFPFIDLEPIVYDSRDFGPVEFTKVASQLHDEDGNLQGWAVALMLRNTQWAPFEKMLSNRLYLDKLWSVYSGPYDRILTGFPPYQRLIQDVTAVVRGENRSVADLGAGTGNVTMSLLEGKHRVTAVENNIGMLDHLARKAQNHNALTIMKASVENLECVADGVFDAAVMVNVLYAVDDPLRCLREVYRILKPGGVLGFSTTHSEINLDALLEAIKAHHHIDNENTDARLINDYDILYKANRTIETNIARKHTREDYCRWVKDAGFEITRYEESTYHNAVMLIHARKP